MKFNFFETNIPVFGLDLSATALKMIQFNRGSKALSLKAYADVSIPKGVIVDDNIVDIAKLSELLTTTFAKPTFGKIDTKHVIASLPESKSFVRVIHIPKMSDAEIDNAILFEAENYIPIPIDQVYIDWQLVRVQEEKLEVLMIASPKDYVDKYLEVLDKAGVIPVALEVESQSLARCVMDIQSSNTTLIVDLDAFRSNLVMVENKTLQFTSSIPVAGNTFTETIAKSLGMTSEKAEDLKKKAGIDNTTEYPNLKTVLMPVLNNLSAEIRNILSFHEQHSQNKVQSILLCGGSAKLAHLDEFLSQSFTDMPELKVSLANPWVNLKDMNPSPMTNLDALGFTTAIGLAMRK